MQEKVNTRFVPGRQLDFFLLASGFSVNAVVNSFLGIFSSVFFSSGWTRLSR